MGANRRLSHRYIYAPAHSQSLPSLCGTGSGGFETERIFLHKSCVFQLSERETEGEEDGNRNEAFKI